MAKAIESPVMCPVMVIDLHITDEALALLRRHMEGITDYEPIASVSWSEGGESWRNESGKKIDIRQLPAGWGVGFYSTEKIPSDHVQMIRGIKFAFDQGSISERLNGKILTVIRGRFEIRDEAGT